MKQFLLYSLTIAAAAMLTVSCNNTTSSATDTPASAPFDMTSLRKIIDEKNHQFAQAHVKRDTAFLNNMFTNDARVFAPNAEAISGRSAIAAINLQFVNFGIKEARIETTALYGSGEYLINEGNYFMSYGNATEKGKFIYVWKKVGTDWKLDVDMWNSDLPVSGK